MTRCTSISALLVLGWSAVTSAATVVVQQGGVATWPGKSAKTCESYGRRYPAVGGVCFYPVDLHAKVGRRPIALWDTVGKKYVGTLEVQTTPFPAINVELPPTMARYVDVSPEDEARAEKETAEVAVILKGEVGEPLFKLPLGKPAATLPKSEDDFGSERTFNAKHKSVHTGRDYPVSIHTAVKSVADGHVVLVADHFYTGNAVYIDHGDGLLSMYFHLETVTVKPGDPVKRGRTVGKVGSTGRATGPHLHLGLRWLGKRIDPALLLDKPSKLPSVNDTKSEAEQKILDAETKEPPETDIVDASED